MKRIMLSLTVLAAAMFSAGAAEANEVKTTRLTSSNAGEIQLAGYGRRHHFRGHRGHRGHHHHHGWRGHGHHHHYPHYRHHRRHYHHGYRGGYSRFNFGYRRPGFGIRFGF